MTKQAHRLLRPLLAAFIGGSTTLAFAPFQLWPIAIISPLLLLLLIAKQQHKAAAFTGFMWGFGQFAVGISWVHISIDTFGGMPKAASLLLMLLLVSYLAVYPAIFATLLNRFFPRHNAIRYLLAAPSLWLLVDWARGWVFTGFPWLWLGYSQIESPLSNLAPIGGVQLITLAVILSAASIVYATIQKKPIVLILPLVIFISSYVLKSIHWVTPDKSTLTSFALIQGNIAQEKKWLPSERMPTLMKFLDLSRVNWDADIIVWPEAAIPALESELPAFLLNVDKAARNNQTALITGVITQNSSGNYYNSVITLGDTPSGEYNYQTQPRYNKHHLLPFGEFVPFADILRPIAPFFNLPMSSFNRGDFIQDNIVAKGKHLVTALCYEIIFGEQVRQNINNDTDFILTLSNDAWFGDSIGPLQHMEIAQMRALETGKPVIRATNNGLTAITDYRGKVIAQVPQFSTEVLRAKVMSTEGKTPYLIIGDWPVIGFILFSTLCMMINILFVRKSR
ncbi:apolipoprotein N-acyltransferase [Vibrio sp. TH_r3]|uniref:apolipoprotein N-acyltransferase n=1 Tax=Vibrio sp. TH_r3 TaxID=3082084 RepID=UPI00295449BD|nr:apolipoprotein N-acyltransferase [Vibrio sp. TH_r3]MDV7104795.1 apolipoprotein N-acyltransferase [Vibrio sp. TH_r3]